MRLIHCADLHLDSAMTTHLSPDKTKERKNELVGTYLRMIDYAKENGVDAILIAGDMFDKKAVSKTTCETVYGSIVNNNEIDFYYLKGNHDSAFFVPSDREVPANLKLFGEEWTTYDLFDDGDRKITLTGLELNAYNSNHIYSTLSLEAKNFNIVTLHGQLMANQAKNDAEVISLKDLHNKNINYLALGHIHKYQEGKLPPAGRYCYPGCLEGRGFDEYGEHGFVLLDIDEESFEVTHTFKPFAKRMIEQIEVDVSGCMTTSDMMNVVETKVLGNHRDNLAKIVLVGEVDVDCEKNIDLILERFKDRFYHLRVGDETKMKIDYQQFKNDTSLRGELVRLLEKDDSLSTKDKTAIIRCGLQVLNGEEIEL